MSAVVVVSLSPTALAVEPGDQAVITITLRNTGTVVERFGFEVLGALGPWATVDPPATSLLPNTERTLTLVLRPPREPSPPAGTYALGVKVLPTERAEETAVAEADVTVNPFRQSQLSIRPTTSRAARHARHVLRVDNGGNTAISATVSGDDPEDALRVRVRPEQVHLPPGGRALLRVDVKPHRTRLRGQPERRPFALTVRQPGLPDQKADAALLQRPLLARWVPRVVVALATLAIGGLLYAQHNAKVKDIAITAPTTTTTSTTTTSTTSTTSTTTTTTSTTTPPTTSTTPPTTAAPAPAVAPGPPQGDNAVAAAIAAADSTACVSYNPAAIPAPTGPALTLGSLSIPLDSQPDAVEAAKLAAHFSQLCVIGSGGLPSQQSFVWSPQPPSTPVDSNVVATGCQPYDHTQVRIASTPGLDAVEAPTSESGKIVVLASLATQADANQAAQVAADHTSLCWIGGTTGGPDDLQDVNHAQAVFYWD